MDEMTLPAGGRRVCTVEAWEWQQQAACRGRGELFFHPPGEREPSRSRRDRAAQELCRTCPVLDTCRAFALAHDEPYGVWGGLTEDDRQRLTPAAVG